MTEQNFIIIENIPVFDTNNSDMFLDGFLHFAISNNGSIDNCHINSYLKHMVSYFLRDKKFNSEKTLSTLNLIIQRFKIK